MKLGLCCISNELKSRDVSFKKMTFKSFCNINDRKAAELKLSEKILNNILTTEQHILFCKQNNIDMYRVSSDLFCCLDHPHLNLKLSMLPLYHEIDQALNSTAKTIKETGIRVSAHPSEFVSLTSLDPKVLTNSIRHLEMHGELFDRLNLPCNYWSPLNIHIRQEGNAFNLYNIIIKHLYKLSASVKNRLVFENNDNKGGVWNCEALVRLFNGSIPVTFDILHHECNPGWFNLEDAINECLKTWHVNGCNEPIFHYSEGVDNTRKHAVMPSAKFGSFYEIYKKNNWKFAMDVELKGKDDAVKAIQVMMI